MWFIIIGLFVFGITRLVNLDLLPIFADEAIYIRWAQLMAWDWHNLFVPLTDGKTPLYMWLLALLLKFNFDPLLTARILSATAGLMTLNGIYFLTKKLFNRQAAFIAAGLAMFQPFLLFYDRMGLTDSLLAALLVWSALFSGSFLMGLTAAAALLVKPSALAYLLILPLFNPRAWREHLKAAVIAGAIYNLLRFSDSFYMIKQRSLDYLRPFELDNFINTSLVFSQWLLSYLGWPVILALVFSWLAAIKFKEKKIALLSLLIILPFCFQAAVGKIVYPRYLLALAPFILIIVSWGLAKLNWRGLALAGILIIGWLKFDYYLLTKPTKAPLVPAEKEQYFTSWSAGYGLKEIKDYLAKLPADQPVLVATEGSFGTLPNGLEIYFNNFENIQILGVGFPEKTVSPGMEKALTEGKKVYLVVNAHRYNLSDEKRLKLIATYERPALSEAKGEKLVFYEVF